MSAKSTSNTVNSADCSADNKSCDLDSAASSEPQLVVKVFNLGVFQTNCFVLSAGSNAWLIDAGESPQVMLDYLDENNLELQAILLTHGHLDHIAGLYEIRQAYPQVPISIHQAEQAFLTDTALNLSAGYGFPVVAPEANTFLTHGQILTLSGIDFEVRCTPGHSPGGVTFYCEVESLAIVGDTLFAGSVGRHDFPTSNGPQLIQSIQEQLYTLPDQTRVLPGHGPETSIGQEKLTNPYVRA